MPIYLRTGPLARRPSLSLVLLLATLATLWVAGGASREDVPGQVLVRGVSAIVLVIAAVFGNRPTLTGIKPVFFFLTAALAAVLWQLIPLPPALWSNFAGHTVVAEAAQVTGIPQPWRPISVVPGATANAAASLIVPIAVLVLVSGLSPSERAYIPGIMLALMAASVLVGLLQFSGAAITNPFINDSLGEVSGSFANRNHFALFLAIGCLVAPVWAFLDGRQSSWRGPTAFGLVLLFVTAILASGSRAGLVLGGLALGTGLFTVWQAISRTLSHYPRWMVITLLSAIGAVIAILVLISFAVDRAVSINRAMILDPGQDLRARALPTILALIRTYFPWGSGWGSFDPVFRMHEPFDLLGPFYLNHAHDDLLEVVLDGGLPGFLVLAAAICWWMRTGVRAWLAGRGTRYALPKLGSAVLLLIIIASAFDYPARTPMMMAILVIAGVWLSEGVGPRGAAPLPDSVHRL